MVSVAPGTSGPVAWYSSSDGDNTAHEPATGGLSVGIGLPGARSVENWTVTVEPAATLAPVGETESTVECGRRGRRRGGGLVAVQPVDGDESAGRDSDDDDADDGDEPPPGTAPGAHVFARHSSGILVGGRRA